ncbi:aminopeptidase, partial [Shinella sp.]|uniref:aminopeptidase n=1 Tax=Shinella sp. TaxID=1870904 RepID=UPI00258D8632
EFVGWNVYETEAYSVEPKTWCFPITGCIVYRGFFDLEGAKSFVAKETTKKNDLFVGPITAYSTLGTFNDPILSSHLSLPDFRLASLIIHELAHQKLYFSGKSEVNEAFAVVVERAGLVKWLNATGREEWLPRVRAAWDEEDRKVGLILNARNQLKTVYANGADDASKAADKTRILHDLEAALCETSCSGDGLPKASSRTFSLNNAYMTPVYTYYGKYDELKAVLDEVGGDLDKFYGEVERRYR